MGIFKKNTQPDSDTDLILKQDTDILDSSDGTDDTDPQIKSVDFDDDIGFETGILSSSFGNIKNDSETLDVIKKKVVKKPLASDNAAFFKEQDIASGNNSPENGVIDNNDNESLLEKCKAYTVDEDGNDYSGDNDSIYELISVAEILKADQLKSLDNLSKKYDIEIDDQTENKTRTSADKHVDNEEPLVEKSPDEKVKTSVFKKLIEQEPNEESDDQKFEDYILKNNPDAVIEDSPSDIPDLSDIDNAQKLNTHIHDHSNDGATLKYIPVKDPESHGNKISVSATTQNIDLGEKLNIDSHDAAKSTVKHEDSEEDFEQFSVENEITDSKILQSEIKKAAITKRASFLCTVASVILSSITAISTSVYIKSGNSMTAGSLIFLLIIFILNCVCCYDMFTSIGMVIRKKVNPDITVTVLSIATAVMTILATVKSDGEFAGDIYRLIFLSSVILTIRNLTVFFKKSARLGNLKAMRSKYDIYGVHFIDDQSIAYSIAKDSVEGDILIAAPQKTKFVNSFNRYCEHTSVLAGKFAPFQIISFVLTIAIGFFGFVKYHSVLGAMFCVVTLLCIFAFPSLFFIDSLPFYAASRKLNKIGASILGTAGARQLDNANSVIISTNEIFPNGTIILKDMKILSENSIDDTIIRATSLTEAVGSPLTPVFKKIAKTDVTYSLPDSDTVKYEDKLGISGWVDNELLFIGNRTLMESHGIEVPSIEIDKRILRSGCFPIYVATVQKACALLIVKYNPDYQIAKELRKLSGLGVTLLFLNSDPNINEAMISDYFDIYEDSIKIVTNAGRYMYDNAVISREPMASPATFKRTNLAFVKIMNCASAIKKSNTLFSVIYIIASILIATGFLYLKLASDTDFYSTGILFLSELIATAFSLVIFLFKKP